MAGIRLERATKIYANGVTALDAMTLDIHDGEFMVLVGPSGCGKSTLLRMIAGLEEVTEGRILIGDRDVTRLRPRDRDIAMVFQNYALYPQMTVEENLGFGLKLRRVPRQERTGRVRQAASTLGLDDAARAPSGAALRRTAAARRHGPGHGARADGVPHGRAAFEPRRQAAGLDARGAGAPARPARRDDRLRDPRPGGGDDARSARRGAPRRRPAAVRHPAVALPRADEPLRRRVHRVAVDERRGGDGDGRPRRVRGDAAAAPAGLGVRQESRATSSSASAPPTSGTRRTRPRDSHGSRYDRTSSRSSAASPTSSSRSTPRAS